MTMETFYLNDVWCLYFHDPYDMNWEPNSYKFITTISSVNDFIEIYMTFNELLTKGMFFIMRDHIMPRWEDENNKNGGCFSLKINKEDVLEKLFENFQSAQVKRDAEIEEATLEYTAQISDFGSDMQEVKNDIKSMKKIYWDVKNTINKIMWTIGGVIAFLTIIQLFTRKALTDFVK